MSLKPLSPGQHTIFYNVRVIPTGALTSPGTNPHFADITYPLQVQKVALLAFFSATDLNTYYMLKLNLKI